MGAEHPFARYNLKIPTNYNTFFKTPLKSGAKLNLGNKIGDRKFLFSNNTETPKNKRLYVDRHLLLSISNLRLQPGEKAHFVVKKENISNYNPIKKSIYHKTPNSSKEPNDTEFVVVELDKLKTGNEEEPHIFLSGEGLIKSDDPVSIRYYVWGYRGVQPQEKESFDNNAKRSSSSTVDLPKGITIYAENPQGIAYERRKIIGKINKQFGIEVGSGITDYESSEVLSLLSTDKKYIPGCGFRIRFKLPGESENVAFEQFNLRALVNSNQEGFGDNWELEEFSSSYADGSSPNMFVGQGTEFDIYKNDNNIIFIHRQMTWFPVPRDYPRFYKLPRYD